MPVFACEQTEGGDLSQIKRAVADLAIGAERSGRAGAML